MAARKPSSKVEFKEPPVPRPQRYDWASIAEQLRAQPGEWALIFTQDRASLITALRMQGIKSLRKADGFEIRSANNKKNTTPPLADLWLRWVDPKKRK